MHIGRMDAFYGTWSWKFAFSSKCIILNMKVLSHSSRRLNTLYLRAYCSLLLSLLIFHLCNNSNPDDCGKCFCWIDWLPTLLKYAIVINNVIRSMLKISSMRWRLIENSVSNAIHWSWHHMLCSMQYSMLAMNALSIKAHQLIYLPVEIWVPLKKLSHDFFKVAALEQKFV